MSGVRSYLILGVAFVLCACSPPQSVPPVDNQLDADRDGYGKPDLNGIWQAMGSAHWDLEVHAARAGPVVELGALGAIPGGLSVVEGGEIPYRPWAREKQRENRADWMALDPAIKCYMPRVPRANYMPFPFQIVQGREHILITYEFAGASRIVSSCGSGLTSPSPSYSRKNVITVMDPSTMPHQIGEKDYSANVPVSPGCHTI